MNREATSRIIKMAEDGVLGWETIARECLARMSETDVADMNRECGWFDEEYLFDEEELYEDEEDENDSISYGAMVEIRSTGRKIMVAVLSVDFAAGHRDLDLYIRERLLKDKISEGELAGGFDILNKEALNKWLDENTF